MMMTDYGYDFSLMVQKKLKNKIKGKIYVAVTDDDVLYIKINNGDDIYEMSYGDFARRLINGLNSDYVAYEVVTEYKKKLLERYFYHD